MKVQLHLCCPSIPLMQKTTLLKVCCSLPESHSCGVMFDLKSMTQLNDNINYLLKWRQVPSKMGPAFILTVINEHKIHTDPVPC